MAEARPLRYSSLCIPLKGIRDGQKRGAGSEKFDPYRPRQRYWQEGAYKTIDAYVNTKQAGCRFP
jgi:hypothetical protein